MEEETTNEICVEIPNIIKTNNKLMEKKYLLNKLLENSSIQNTLTQVKDHVEEPRHNFLLSILEKNKFNLDDSIQDLILKCYRGDDSTINSETVKEDIRVVNNK